MASRLVYPYAKDVGDTCRNLKKNVVDRRRQSTKEKRLKINENPEKNEQKKNISYVIELTGQPKKNKTEDWEKAGDCGYVKSAKRCTKVLELSGGDSRSTTTKGPSGDHRSKRAYKKETSCQTSTTTKYVQITPKIIHQNEIMLSKLRRNEELLQQIKRHKDMIQLLKTRIKNTGTEHADSDKEKETSKDQEKEENQLKNKQESKQTLQEPKRQTKLLKEKLVNNKLEPIQHVRNNALKLFKLRRNGLPDIKERPEPDDIKSIESIMSKLMKTPIGIDQRHTVRTMYGTTIKKLSRNKNDRPLSPRHLTQYTNYTPLTIAKPNVSKKGNYGTQMIPSLKPVINFKPIKKPIDAIQLMRRKIAFI